jgi:hypothetical protein
MNICDDKHIMDLLIHDEDDEFTEAIVLIVNNLANYAADDADNTPVVPPFVWSTNAPSDPCTDIAMDPSSPSLASCALMAADRSHERAVSVEPSSLECLKLN